MWRLVMNLGETTEEASIAKEAEVRINERFDFII